MKKIALITTMISALMGASSVNAGFWSNTLGTMAGNAMSGSTSSGGQNDVDATKTEKRIQQVLTKLGYYESNIDGDLNTFETRSAIEELQSYYGLDDNGILSETEKQDILYMHDLLKNYKMEWQYPEDKDSKKLKKIYKAFDKLEKRFSKGKFAKTYLSNKFKKEIKERRAYLDKETEANLLGTWCFVASKSKGKEYKNSKKSADLFGRFVDGFFDANIYCLFILDRCA